jgi:HAD superfamily hydrolase (TIGR01458 family)
MTDRFKNTKAFLFDLDGTLHIGNKVIDGAIETIKFIKEKNFPCRFVTNTTTKTLSDLHQQMTDIGLPVLKEELINTTKVAIQYLRKYDKPKCYFVLNEEVKKDFSEFIEDTLNPDFIIIGDIDDKWNYTLLNKLFNMIMNGSKLIALHKGRFWQTEEGLKIDIGAFITGLEYTTGKEATVLGKPTRDFFKFAIDGLGIQPGNIAMVGDDINNDVAGAQGLGMFGILVKTGKFRQDYINRSGIKPDLIIDSIKEIKDIWS